MKVTLETQNSVLPLNLKKLIEEGKQTDEELSLVCGVEPNTIYRWANGLAIPSFTNYIRLAEFNSVSLEYLLGNTTIRENDIFSYEINNRIAELRKENNFSKLKIEKMTGIKTTTIKKYEESEGNLRLTTYLKFANLFNVSIDYLLGFTNSRTWEEFITNKYPFKHIKPGTPICIYKDDEVIYALLDSTGKKVIFPNQDTKSINSKYFEKYRVEILGGLNEKFLL